MTLATSYPDSMIDYNRKVKFIPLMDDNYIAVDRIKTFALYSKMTWARYITEHKHWMKIEQSYLANVGDYYMGLKINVLSDNIKTTTSSSYYTGFIKFSVYDFQFRNRCYAERLLVSSEIRYI